MSLEGHDSIKKLKNALMEEEKLHCIQSSSLEHHESIESLKAALYGGLPDVPDCAAAVLDGGLPDSSSCAAPLWSESARWKKASNARLKLSHAELCATRACLDRHAPNRHM